MAQEMGEQLTNERAALKRAGDDAHMAAAAHAQQLAQRQGEAPQSSRITNGKADVTGWRRRLHISLPLLIGTLPPYPLTPPKTMSGKATDGCSI